MKIEVVPGKYVVAVSGGVDSMVLLDLLQKQPDVELVVAHYDHGIREDSVEDVELVEEIAEKAGLTFVQEQGKLGPKTSEATARDARYDFLRRAQDEYKARAIITAHHQDDVIETALINLLRGTNRRGLSSLKSTDNLLRPLLAVPKSDILKYAAEHDTHWREDVTNNDETYLRNQVRHRLVPKLSPEQRKKLTDIITKAEHTNGELDTLLAAELELVRTQNGLNRGAFVLLGHDLAKEILALWLRQNGLNDYDAKTLERLVVAAKTGRAGTSHDVLHGRCLEVGKDFLALTSAQR